MKSSLQSFKYALCKCKKNDECHQANALALALPKSFWRKIETFNKPCSLPTSVGKIKGAKNIVICGKSIFFSFRN